VVLSAYVFVQLFSSPPQSLVVVRPQAPALPIANSPTLRTPPPPAMANAPRQTTTANPPAAANPTPTVIAPAASVNTTTATPNKQTGTPQRNPADNPQRVTPLSP
jgi:hypothetical protein